MNSDNDREKIFYENLLDSLIGSNILNKDTVYDELDALEIAAQLSGYYD